MSDSRSRAIASELAKSAVVAQVTAPTPERRVGEAAVPLTMSEEGQNAARILMEAHPMVIPLFEGVVAELDKAEAEVTRLTAEVERLKWEAVVWKSSLECWGRHHPWCWMVTQAGVEGVYCNCGYHEALMGKDRSHEVAQLSTHDAEKVRLFEERIRASITPETEEAARRFVAARDVFAASGDALSSPTPAPEATE